MDLKKYLGTVVDVTIDRPIGTKHPEYGYKYPINYGYIAGTKMSDGEELDVYILGVTGALQKFSGKCIAIIHRTNDDDDDKLIVVPDGIIFSDKKINQLIEFQEKWFKHIIIR